MGVRMECLYVKEKAPVFFLRNLIGSEKGSSKLGRLHMDKKEHWYARIQ